MTRNIKYLMAFIAMVSFGFQASAKGNGTADAVAMNTKEIETEITERLQNIGEQQLQLTDAIVEVSFHINEKGNVVVENINSGSSIANMAVLAQLQKNNMNVASELQNRSYTIRIHYTSK